MSKLYATLSSDTRKRQVTNCGRGHIDTHVRSGDHGVISNIMIGTNGDTVIELWTTGGSNDSTPKKHVATITNGHIVYKTASERITDANTLAMSRL